MPARPKSKQPKYAPAREGGAKPYVIVKWGRGREYKKIGWGHSPSEAAYDAYRRMGTGEYITRKRRATPADMDELRH